MGITQALQRAADRLDRWTGVKGVGWPNVGWAPPPGWVGQSASGVSVTEDTARTVAAWYAGLRVISEDVASLPLIVYRRDGRSRDRATDSPFYRLLHDAPNPEMTSFVFREVMQSHLLTWGNAYAEKEVNGVGRTIALWPLRPDRMEVTWENGRRAYAYRPTAMGAPIDIPASRVFHIPGLGFDGLVGYSVLRMARETLGASIALRDYGNRVVKNDARPGTILTHPARLSDPARKNIKDSWDEANRREGAGRTALLEEGITVTTFGYPPEDIQFLESQQWQVTEVARWLRLAPHKIGDLTRATFSNIEEQNIDHVTSTIRPWCVRWEQQLAKDVVTEPGLFAEHLMDGLLRGRTLERAQANAIRAQWLTTTPNEWRAQDNLNPVPWGDEPVRTPNNSAAMVPAPTDAKGVDVVVHNHPPGITVNPPDITVNPPEVKVEGSTFRIDGLAVADASLEKLGDRIVTAQEATARALSDEVRDTSKALSTAVAAVGGTVRAEVRAAAPRKARPTVQNVEYDEQKRIAAIVTSDGERVTRRIVHRDAEGLVLATEEREEPA